VLEIEHDDLDWIRPHVVHTAPLDPETLTGTTSHYLELKFRTEDFEELRKCLTTAAQPRRTWSGQHFINLPIEMMPEGILRLTWRGDMHNSYIMPSLKKAMRLLGAKFPARPEISEMNESMMASVE